MEQTNKPKVAEAVPHATEISKMTEAEKKALELSGEAEHQTGEKREEAVEKASELQNGPGKA